MDILECSLCKSKNIQKLQVNSRLELLSDEKASGAVVTQSVTQVAYAYGCHDCGHIDFFCNLPLRK